jgi:Type I phosphodiesterase / nucleotide pyrophosphatase
MTIEPPITGRGLVNLMAELEFRLTGAAPSPRLDEDLAALIPDSPTYVLVVIDGLGIAQLQHEPSRSLNASLAGALQAPFPTTTSVSLATVATGLPPSRHGLVSHLTWMEELDRVVNTLKWVDLAGQPVIHDYRSVLAAPNLWERLRSSDIEPVTVQPSPFTGSPLSRLLYRGARFEGAWDDADLVEATIQLAGENGRLILTYIWQVDFAGHVSGLGSPEFDQAMKLADQAWDALASRLPPEATLIGTADHGLIEYREDDKILIRGAPLDTLRYAGDPRGVQIWGSDQHLAEVEAMTGGTLVAPESVFDEGLDDRTRSRLGDALLLAPPGKVILPPGFDKRLKCYHGGREPAEIEIPLLIA